MRTSALTALASLLLLVLTACDGPAEELPGTYVGRLDTTIQASRMANLHPHGGRYQADITHYTNATSTEGLRLSVRRVADVAGNPSYDANLGDMCDLRFQLLEGGSISNNMFPVRCRCQLDGHWVEGDAIVTGDFTDSELRFEVDVTLPRLEYTGGCTHSFEAPRP